MDFWKYIDGLAQERRNSSALAVELYLSCTKSRYNMLNFVQQRVNKLWPGLWSPNLLQNVIGFLTK